MFDVEQRINEACRNILGAAGLILSGRERVLAFGSDPEASARNWCQRNGHVFEPMEDPDIGTGDALYAWELAFWADGTSMKCAGAVLPSGTHVMTWLK